MTFSPQRFFRWRWLAILFVMWAGMAIASGNLGWVVRTWQSNDGLPDNAVTGVFQTRDGYLWVATRNGLARFDGVHFEKLSLTDFSPTKSSAALSEGITLLFGTHADGLLLATDHGPLVYLHAGTLKVLTNSLPTNSRAMAVTEDNEGNLFVSCGSTIIRIQGELSKELTTQDGVPDGNCTSLITDVKGRVWAAKGAEVGIFHGDHFQKVVDFPNGWQQLAVAKTGGVWICSNNQLFICSENGALRKIGTFDLENSTVGPSAVLEDRNGNVWIGTRRSGLFCYDGSGFQSIPTSHNTILCLAEDKEGNVWVGTSGGGLNQVRSKLIQLEGAETGVASQTIQTLCEDSTNRLWGVSQNGLVLLRTNGGWSLASDDTNWFNIRTTCFTADRQGALWMGTTSHKLVRWQNGVFTYWGPDDGLSGSFFRKMISTSTGDVWMTAGPPETLQYFRNGTLGTVPLPRRFHHTRAMVEGENGSVFLAGENGGLLRVEKDSVEDLTDKTGEQHRTIHCLAATADGSLWIGYENAGLGRLSKDGRFSLISHQQGLYDDNIWQIVDDEAGSLWFGSDRGIFRVKKDMLDAVAEGHLVGVYSVHYGADEGLPLLRPNPENAGGAVYGHDGRLWMPMGASLAVINLKKSQEDPAPPTVLLTRIAIDEHTVATYRGDIMPALGHAATDKPEANLRLPPTHHRLDFDFTTLNFATPENISFRYKLDGLDDDWTQPGSRRSATYSRLAPGNYRFRVMACNSSGIWNETGASFGFTVIPFFWQRWWFQLISVATFAAILLKAGRYFSHRKLQRKLLKLEQQAALDRERARIARDLHDDLGSCLTQIVMVSGLNRRGRIPNEKANEEVQAMTQYAIRALDQTVWAVNPENDTVPAFINYAGHFVVDFLRTAGIKCHADIPEQLPDRSIPAEARHNLFLVIKEAVNNIVRHSQATEVKFSIVVSPGSLHFSIHDNGRGFVPVAGEPGADGLQNMRRRMEELGEQFRIETAPETGTHIEFTYQLPGQAV